MHSGTQHNAASEANGLMRMAEVVERTGVPKTTILFYVKEGLLPEPQKPYPNQAWYTDEHVERLLLIKEAQRRYHYPLSKIRRLLAMVDQGADPALVLRLGERVYTARGPVQSDRRWSFDEFCEETELAPALVRQALAMRLLNPLTGGEDLEFDSADVEAALALKAGEKYGFDLTSLEFLVEHARKIAEGEMALRRDAVAGRSINEDLAMTAELTDMARTLNTYVVDRIFIETATGQSVGDTPPVAAAEAPAWTTNAPDWPMR